MPVVKCRRLPSLRTPAAVLAFGGWGDAAEASTTSVSSLVAELSAKEFATIDPEDFYDFTEVRPRVALDEASVRQIEWPEATLSYKKLPKADADIILFQGFEPQLRWKTFTNGLLEFFERLQVSAIYTLGALLADVPHTRTAQLTGFATTAELRERMLVRGIRSSRYEGPTGIVGVLHEASFRRGLPSASLWAAAPHYISSATNPKVALALLEGLTSLMDWSPDLAVAREEARVFEKEVDEILGRNPQAVAYVKQLEERLDRNSPEETPLMPANDMLMHDLEDFLRRGRDNKPRGDA
jgi:proteasome assembly chaperone (PAC2) family protein